ncbi:MAG: hypothetical protein ACK5PB_03955 [Pirellula sp.]|jgi:hypothetical protein
MMRRKQGASRRGIALVVVFVLVMLVTLAAYRFSFVMQSEYRLAKLYEEQVDARQAAWSGIEQASVMLDKPLSSRPTLMVENSEASVNKGNLFRGELVRANETQSTGTSQIEPWKFALISPSRGTVASGTEEMGATAEPMSRGEGVWRWGLENESAKIPIQALKEWEKTKPGHAKSVLSKLPGVKPEIIEPWLIQEGVLSPSRRIGIPSLPTESPSRSPDNQERTGDVNADTNPIGMGNNRDSQAVSSAAVQASFWSGGDLNQNYRLDPLELIWLERQSRAVSGSAVRSSVSVSDESVALQRYLTRYSGCRNERFDGSERIYVNDPDLRGLHRKLMGVWPQPLADYIILVRQYGPTTASRRGRRSGAATEVVAPNSSTDSNNSTIDWNVAGKYQIRTLFELIDARLTIPIAANSQSLQNKSIVSPFSSRSAEGSNYLIRLLDDCTTDRRKFQEGKIDVWDAPLEVLMSIPEMDEGTANRIITARQDETIRQQSAGTLAWLLQRRIVDLPTLLKWEPFLTARSDVYKTQALGYRDQTTSVYRCTVTIDGSQIPARTKELKTWHAWDAGFSLDEFVVERE